MNEYDVEKPHALRRTYRECDIGDNAWQAFLNAAEFLNRLSRKLNKPSPTYVVVGPLENLVTIPYGGIPKAEDLQQDVPVPIQEVGPEYFELSSSIAHILYDSRESPNTVEICRCYWPEGVSEEELDKLLQEALGKPKKPVVGE